MAIRIAALRALMVLMTARAAAQNIVPSNATIRNPQFMLIGGPQTKDKVGDLNPLSAAASSLTSTSGLPGALYRATTETASNISTSNIAFISCDNTAYPGNLQAINVIRTVVDRKALAILLYSTEAQTCSIVNDSSLDPVVIYSLTDRSAAQSIQTQLDNIPSSNKLLVKIAHQGNTSQTNNSTPAGTTGSNGSSNSSPLGPSPSTAVAMIILYSITGVITALFLVIIVTGAIRAHRHPDRYGPRDVMGRPRQSRAKGLARAMLDSIPIVKFGENDTTKPTDVELASQRAESATEREERHASPAVQLKPPTMDGDAVPVQATRRSLPDGIAPAENIGASYESPSERVALGCSICTEDFEIGQNIRVLPCGHKFHPACVDPWLLNVSGTCPLCRIDLRPTTSRTSTDGDVQNDGDVRRSNSFSPPLEEPEHSVDQINPTHSAGRDQPRRRSRIISIFAPDRFNNSTLEERLAVIRGLRERPIQSGSSSASSQTNTRDEVGPTETTGEDARRRRRLTMRLQDVFGIRTRRQGESPERENNFLD